MLTGAPNMVKSRMYLERHRQRQSQGDRYTQALPSCAPGTLLNQCRVHEIKKHTVLHVFVMSIPLKPGFSAVSRTDVVYKLPDILVQALYTVRHVFSSILGRVTN